ncbi:MAG: alpha/beta hydrolase family protein [Eubacteriales bacterium]|nr:alpha/beta hydrolase family protein [Eubacteriales bacterium]
MALLTANFRSAALAHETAVNIILPEGCPEEDIPTVFLLHGMHGDHSSWVRKTCIERYAAERRLAVVMPDGENSFYADMKYGKKYFTYVSEELVDYVRKILRLSRKRERTFVCGLSMGGYGAFKLAMKKPEQYAAAASLSGCLDIAARLDNCPWQREATAIWGDDFATSVRGSDDDLLMLMRRFDDPALPRPRLYAACGTEDGLYGSNLVFKEAVENTELEFRFEASPGIHNWVFWDRNVVPALDFFLERKLK